MKNSETVVVRADEIQDGEMRLVRVGETNVLLTKIDGTFHAIGDRCPHNGAPLHEGVLCRDRVVCPWHHACFSAITGYQQEPPGLDSLPHFRVRVEGERVIVEVPANPAESRRLTRGYYQPCADWRTFLIIGMGAAGVTAVETLRHAGFQGRIVAVTQSHCLPYDRTLLSKTGLVGEGSEELEPLRSARFYRDYQIEVLRNHTVTSLNATPKQVTFASGKTLNYDVVLIATGSRARSLEVPGADLARIETLRTLMDLDPIVATAKSARRAIVVGSSFIAMETAASLTQRGLSVTVVTPDAVPFEKVLGPEVGQMLQRLHEKRGVTFHTRAKVTRFEGRDRVEAAILDGGERLETDLVVVGIGVEPVTEFINGVDIDPRDGGVWVDEHLLARNNIYHVYAAGDIASYPDPRTGESVRIEHWRVAAGQGRIAARNMLGQEIPFTDVPFFWTQQFDWQLRYVGYASEWDEVSIRGDLDGGEFLAFYIRNDRILAAVGCARDRDIAAIGELMRLDRMPTPDAVKSHCVDWPEMLRSSHL